VGRTRRFSITTRRRVAEARLHPGGGPSLDAAAAVATNVERSRGKKIVAPRVMTTSLSAIMKRLHEPCAFSTRDPFSYRPRRESERDWYRLVSAHRLLDRRPIRAAAMLSARVSNANQDSEDTS
jgi:hypothetical protein